MIKIVWLIAALALTGCSFGAPKLLYADGSGRIPVNARRGVSLTPPAAATTTTPATPQQSPAAAPDE